jgi:hypothetical protein
VTVDAWAQHPTQRFLASKWLASLRRWRGEEILAGEIPIETTLAAMDAAGVEVALLSAWHGPTGELIANDEVAGWVAAHPTRFRGLAAVDLGPLRPSEPGRPIPYIDQVALDFPELTIVCGHIGYPWTEEMVAVARKHERVYIDTSAYKVERYPPELVAYLRTGGGSRKVMFGSNYPMITPAEALRGLDSLGLTDEAREAFLDGNARRVFDL